jgi:hypothetical protein
MLLLALLECDAVDCVNCSLCDLLLNKSSLHKNSAILMLRLLLNHIIIIELLASLMLLPSIGDGEYLDTCRK